jgi:putative transposase
MEDRLQLSITGILQNNKHKLLAINTMPHHLHFFVGLSPDQSISEILRLVKTGNTVSIINEAFTKIKVQSQDGYNAFSNSRSQIHGLVKYILNQNHHYAKKTFRKEYLEIFKDYAVEYDENIFFMTC